MAAVAAERVQLSPDLELELDAIARGVLVEAVPETAADVEARARAARFIGRCLTERETTLDYHTEALAVRPIESLYDAIQLAAEGDTAARKMIETNVATDVVERTIKSGHVIQVELEVDEAGRIQQFGQSMESVQANSLRLMAHDPAMRQRTEAEATNTFRIHELYKQGKLEDYSFVVISRAADNMTAEQMQAAGFFTDTMSCAIQITSARGTKLTTESAFVAGVSRPGEARHDAATVVGLGDRLGVDFAGKSAAELIDTPLLMHNSLLPNGVIDLVELYDEVAGGTFFGEAKPAELYKEYKQKCLDREATLQPKVASITAELIAEAEQITDRVQATQRLHKLSEKHMVQQAMFDTSIDPRVFGPAAAYIEAGRRQFELGNVEIGLQLTRQAERTAVSSSCPNGTGRAEGGAGAEAGGISSDEEVGDCEFISKKCPKCNAKNVKTKISKGKISGSCGCTASLK